jgi:hypothetical protein
MKDLVPCYLQPHVASELKRLAVLAGSESHAIERLIEFWTANQASGTSRKVESTAGPALKPAAHVWRSSTGDELPVGARLEATYKGRTYHAIVEQQGIRFGKQLHQSPSAAGRAVKASVGVSGSAGQTDGRTFWNVRDPASGRRVTIGELNPRNVIDADELLRELSESSS